MTLLGAAVAPPAIARAQQVPRIGYLNAGTANSVYTRRTQEGLKQGLAEYGMTEGRDYVLETCFAEGNYDRICPVRDSSEAVASQPIRGTFPACCARAPYGQATAALPSITMT